MRQTAHIALIIEENIKVNLALQNHSFSNSEPNTTVQMLMRTMFIKCVRGAGSKAPFNAKICTYMLCIMI